MAWVVPSNFTAGQTAGVSTALNQMLADLALLGGAWTSYTVTTSNITLGTGGTCVGAFAQAGKMVDFRITLTLGTSGALTGAATFSLPATPVSAILSSPSTMFPVATAGMYDSSASAHLYGVARINSGASSVVVSWNNSAGTGQNNANATAPWTWAAGDAIEILGRYEAA